jgi:multiple sugar transport system permease protein
MRSASHKKSLNRILTENSLKKSREERSDRGGDDSDNGHDKGRLKNRLVSWAFLAPSILGVMVFFGSPFMVVIYYSFLNNPIQHQFRGLWNYRLVLHNRAFQIAAFNTIRFSLIAVPLAVVLSLLLAMVLESRIPGKTVFRSMFLSPMMVPIASIVLIWQVLFHYNGLVNNIFGIFGMNPVDWLKSSHAQFVIIILFLWKNLGYNMILFMAALSSVPDDQLEVARLEGASPLQTFFYIKLRYISSTVMFVTLMSLINSFKVFRETYMMAGDYPHEALYMLQHYMNNVYARLN